MEVEDAINIVLVLAREHIDSFNLSPEDEEMDKAQREACNTIEDFFTNVVFKDEDHG